MSSTRLISEILLLVGTLLLCMVAVAATKTRFIDGDGMDSIAQTVCSRSLGSYAQIGHKLEACRNNHKDALKLLDDIVSLRNDNVCSEEKISLIEKFHHTYISKTKKDKKQQQLDKTLKAPKPFRNFFYHYATKVATVCKNSLIKRMDEAAPIEEENSRVYIETIQKVDDFLEDFATELGSTSGSFKTYGEISLIWNYIDKLPIREDNSYISQEGARITFRMHDAKQMKAFQRECSTRLKPAYGVLLLPIIRLIDLGYYLDDEPFASELAVREDLRRLIGVAQLCEFVLPIRVIPSINSFSDKLILLTKKEASRIPVDPEEEEEEEEEKVEPIVMPDEADLQDRNSLLDLNGLDSATPDGAHKFVKSIRANIKAREKTLRSLYSKMVSSLVDRAKSMFGKIFYSRKGEDKNSVNKDTRKNQEDRGDGDCEISDLVKEPQSFSKNVFGTVAANLASLFKLLLTTGFGVFYVIPIMLFRFLFETLKLILVPILFVVVNPILYFSKPRARKSKTLLDRLI